jgi:hypothetical protein
MTVVDIKRASKGMQETVMSKEALLLKAIVVKCNLR